MVFQPTQFGKYYLTRRIAVGGMAEIFQAKLFGVGGFEKPMVVKQILPQYSRNAEFINMFIDEAKIGVTLTHGNIVPVYELGRIGETYFIAMEYVPGKDLAELLEKARARAMPLSPEHAAYIAIEVCNGLDYAHRRTDERGDPLGVVHRDISPPNILISMDGQIKITDFGIAKAIHKLGTTESGVVKGTFGYMSPEQVRGLPVDHRTDVFSTGILLHEMLTGRRLFVGKNDLEAIERVKEAQIPAPSAINPGVPGAIDPIVFKALTKDPVDRYRDANEFQLALSRFLFTSGTGATSATLSNYMKRLFDDERQQRLQDDEEEILYSSTLSAEAPPPVVDNATHSYAVHPELEEATTVMQHPAPELMGELTPSMPQDEVAMHVAQMRLGTPMDVAQMRPGTPMDVGGGEARALGETRALPALTETPTDETLEPPFEDELPTAIFTSAQTPKKPEVPELRFPPQKDRAAKSRPEQSRPATLPSIPSMVRKGAKGAGPPGPEEQFPSADELASLADQLEEATTEPRIVPGEAVPQAPKLVPPTAQARPDAAQARPDTPPRPEPKDPAEPAPRSDLSGGAALLLNEMMPGAWPDPAEADVQPEAADLPELNVTADSGPRAPAGRHARAGPRAPDGALRDESAARPRAPAGALRDAATARGMEQRDSLEVPPNVHRVSPHRKSRISGVLSGTMRLFVEGLADEQEDEPPDPSAHDIVVPGNLSDSTGALRIPRTIKPTVLAWIIIGVVVLGATLFVIHKKTRLFAGGADGADTLKVDDIKPPEPEKQVKLGEITVTAEPAGASFFLYAGETPVRVNVDRGREQVFRVERDGFRTVYRTVKPEEFVEGKAAISVALEPVGSGAREELPQTEPPDGPTGQKGSLSIKSDPPKGMVWHLAGQGTLALRQVRLDKSRYFKVMLPGHRPAFVRISEVDFPAGTDSYSTSVKLEPEADAVVADGGASVAAAPDAAAPDAAQAQTPKPAAKVRHRPRHRPRVKKRPRKKPASKKKPTKKPAGKGINLPDWAR